jgi:circadian clock protein KaiC
VMVSAYLRGVHALTITDAGINVYPRLESLSSPDQGPRRDDRLSFNIPRFDAMLGGGLPSESTTMLLGPSGVGKTSMGLKFLEGSTSECPGLAISFYETEARARVKARSLGIDLEGPLERGDLEFVWHRPTEISLDTLADQILRAVTRRRVRRLFIDGFNALLVASGSPERVPQFFSALAEELRAKGATTLYTAELHEIFSPRIAPPAEGISPLLENLIVMRFVEVEATVRRLVSVLKMRASMFEPSLRELTLSSDGISILDSFAHSEAVLKGSPRSSNKRESAKKAGRKSKPGARRRR